jgi:hypothetical protein
MKAQVSAEVIFIYVFMLLLFMFAAYSAMDKQITSEKIKDTLDLREECIRISNFISSVYTTGNGTAATIRLKHYLTLPGNGSIVLARTVNVSESRPPQNIAILASEAGPTTQIFFDNMTTRIDPDWYKVCFDDLGTGPGCQTYGPNPMSQASWDSINWTFADLIKNITDNPDYYTTIYLEDPTMYYDAAYQGTPYIDILTNWVSNGNVLIMSEHAWCTEAMVLWFCISWSYNNNSAICDPSGCSYNNWPFIGTILHQKANRAGWANVVNDSNEFSLTVGDNFRMEERNWLEYVDATNFYTIAQYESACSSNCAWPAADYMDNPAIASWDIGTGKFYYFADFQILDGSISQEEYADSLAQVIEEAYYILHFTSDAETCKLPVETRAYENLNGLVRFTNDNGRVAAEIIGN